MGKKGVVYSTQGINDFICAIFSMPIGGVGEASCAAQSSAPAKNKAHCCVTECPSKWRRCPKCLEQGISNSCSVDPKTGYCKFHKKHGPMAKHKGNNDKGILGNDFSEADKYIAKHTGIGTADEESENLKSVIKVRRKSKDSIKKESEVDDFIKDQISKGLKKQVIREIKVDEIKPLKGQPRLYFNESKINELSGCMNEFGVIIEVKVRPIKGDPNFKYELIDGERRLRAAKKAGLKTIRAIILDIKNKEVQLLISFMANLNREGHTELEKAFAIKKTQEAFGFSGVKIARILGQPDSWVVNRLQLLKLDEEVQALMDISRPKSNRLNFSIAIKLAPFPKDLQIETANEILKQGMKTNKAHAFIRRKARENCIALWRRQKPDDNYRNFKNLLSRIKEGVEIFLLEMTLEDVQKMFKHRDRKDGRIARLKIDVCVKKLQELRAKIT